MALSEAGEDLILLRILSGKALLPLEGGTAQRNFSPRWGGHSPLEGNTTLGCYSSQFGGCAPRESSAAASPVVPCSNWMLCVVQRRPRFYFQMKTHLRYLSPHSLDHSRLYDPSPQRGPCFPQEARSVSGLVTKRERH